MKERAKDLICNYFTPFTIMLMSLSTAYNSIILIEVNWILSLAFAGLSFLLLLLFLYILKEIKLFKLWYEKFSIKHNEFMKNL